MMMQHGSKWSARNSEGAFVANTTALEQLLLSSSVASVHFIGIVDEVVVAVVIVVLSICCVELVVIAESASIRSRSSLKRHQSTSQHKRTKPGQSNKETLERGAQPTKDQPLRNSGKEKAGPAFWSVRGVRSSQTPLKRRPLPSATASITSAALLAAQSSGRLPKHSATTTTTTQSTVTSTHANSSRAKIRPFSITQPMPTTKTYFVIDPHTTPGL